MFPVTSQSSWTATAGGRRRGLRAAGHKQGIGAVRMAIEQCAKRGVEALTVFAFSSENWKRPQDEVSSLMGLFMDALDREIAELHKNKVRVRFIASARTSRCACRHALRPLKNDGRIRGSSQVP
jgi:undecaprenyl diphosphate synthase